MKVLKWMVDFGVVLCLGWGIYSVLAGGGEADNTVAITIEDSEGNPRTVFCAGEKVVLKAGPVQEPAPCSCPDGLPYEYAIQGYQDGDLSACEECMELSGTVWDGVFNIKVGECYWQGGSLAYQIDGKRMMTSWLRLDADNCTWKMAIYCIGPEGTETVWAGTKGTGETPAGEYTRAGGCDETPTLTIVPTVPDGADGLTYTWSIENTTTGETFDDTGQKITFTDTATPGVYSATVVVTDSGGGEVDRGTATFTVVQVTILTRRQGTTEWQSSGTAIAVGAVDSAIHKADVEISTDPAMADLGLTVELSAAIAYEVNRDAKLAIGGGDPLVGPIGTKTVSTGSGGKVSGVLTSSDRADSTAGITVKLNGTTAASTQIAFVWDNYTGEDFWESSREYIEPGKTSTEKVKFKLDDVALDGHEIAFYIEHVKYLDEETNEVHELVNTPDAPSDLSEYAKFSPQTVKTDSDGIATTELAMYKVAGKQMLYLEMVAYDFSARTIGRTVPLASSSAAATSPSGEEGTSEEPDPRKNAKSKQSTTESIRGWGFVQVWQKVPAIAGPKNRPATHKKFEFKVFVAGKPKKGACKFSLQRWDGKKKSWVDAKAGQATIRLSRKKGKAWLNGETSQTNGYIYTGSFEAYMPGGYKVNFSCKGSQEGKVVRAYSARIRTKRQGVEPPEKMFVGRVPVSKDRYGILPLSYFSNSEQKEADQKIRKTEWSFMATPYHAGAPGVWIPYKNKILFGKFATVKAAEKTSEATVKLNHKGDGWLVRGPKKGVFAMNGIAKLHVRFVQRRVDWSLRTRDRWRLATDTQLANLGGKKVPTTKNLPGHFEKFHFIVPDLDIGSPDGDPKAAGNGGADRYNEVVFDDGAYYIPAANLQGKGRTGREPAGEGKLVLRTKMLAGLSATAKKLVEDRCQWTIEAAGAIRPAYNPKKRTGREVTVTYGKMPAKYDEFGKKLITLNFAGQKHWHWYQHVEFFYHYEGKKHPNEEPVPKAGKSPNAPNIWYYYLQNAKVNAGLSTPVPIKWVNRDDPFGFSGCYVSGRNKRIELFNKMQDKVIASFISTVFHELGHAANDGVHPPGAGFSTGWADRTHRITSAQGRWDHGGPTDEKLVELYLTTYLEQTLKKDTPEWRRAWQEATGAAPPNDKLNNDDLVKYFGDGDNDDGDGDLGHHKLDTVPDVVDLYYERKWWSIGANGRGECLKREQEIEAADGTLTPAGNRLRNADWADIGRWKQYH